MPVIANKYIPETHTRTEQQIIDGLLEEAADIERSGLMRLHAKDRELQRIWLALEQRGFEMMKGEEEDAGCIVTRAKGPHGAKCTTAMCHCPVVHRVKIYDD